MKIKFYIIICLLSIISCSKKEIEKNESDEKLKTLIDSLENNFNADIDWERKLSDGKIFRIEPILAIELEELWKNKNIIFFGEIIDISKKDSINNSIIISTGIYPLKSNKFSTQLKLELLFNPDKQDQLSNTEDYKNLLGTNKYMVVVARINEIKSNTYFEEGNEFQEKIGLGELIYLKSILKY